MSPAAHTISTTAGRVIQRRATTGSVSSVFYLKEAGMKEAKTAENVFVAGIGIPMAMMGLGGLYSIATNSWSTPSSSVPSSSSSHH